jgi:hypothetical protein
LFDRFVTVDWSAASQPKTGKDSVWICDLRAEGKPSTLNPRTRGQAEGLVRDILCEARDLGQRVLVGFDFPYAFPTGFAAALGLEGPAWRAVWDYLEFAIRDDGRTNKSNRFEVASAINARLPE